MQEIGHLIDPIATAARGEAAQLGHKVLVCLFPLAASAGLIHYQFSPKQSTYYPSVSHQGLFLSQVTQLASYFEPLIVASVGLASRLLDHQQQMTILDQTKTLSESALQMLYAAKEGGGNPKVHHSNTTSVG